MSFDPRTRLPVTHPDYRFPPSRNPYWAKLKTLKGLAYSDEEVETRRGSWLGAFPASRPGRKLHVEIGCNAGHVTVEWAARDPENAYIGLDFKVKAIYRAAEKASKRGLQNLIFLRSPAERLGFIFAPGEIDHLHLFFPDPWPKKSQWKNRFVNPANLTLLHGLLKSGGTLHIKTDHAGYFAWMEDALRETGPLWECLEREADLHSRHPDPLTLQIPEVTLFEKLFIRDGVPIHSLRLKKRP